MDRICPKPLFGEKIGNIEIDIRCLSRALVNFLSDNVVTMANGKTEMIPIPKKEVFFSPLIVSSEEKRIHSEFFDNSHPNRTKDKYLRLRNHIINRWYITTLLYCYSKQSDAMFRNLRYYQGNR